MNYKIGNTSIVNIGAKPMATGQYFALQGILDLPKRLGKTEHDWGTSIEPFVHEMDIALDGRTLTLHVAILPSNLENFKSACIASKTIAFKYIYEIDEFEQEILEDEFDVVCKDEIKVRKAGKYLLVQVDFWQNEFIQQPIEVVPSFSGVFRLDNYDLRKDFGISVSQNNGHLNTAKRIDVKTTEFYERTNYRGQREVSFNCSMIGRNFADIYYKMNQLQSILMAPGLRKMTYQNITFDVYFKDGIKVNVINERILTFVLKGIVNDNHI